jgi:glutamate-1-semialdehyde 2,1-aminomutase
MLPLAERLAAGLRTAIQRHDLPWCVTQIGARCEFQFRPQPPQNGSEAEAAFDPLLERAIHLYLLNRGVLITPFHNMTLVCPQTSANDVDRLLNAFSACLDEIVTS